MLFVHVIFSIHLCYDLVGLFPMLRKGRVGMKSVPILFRFFPAGMGHDVDEGVSPGRILVGHPVADDIKFLFFLWIYYAAKYRREGRPAAPPPLYTPLLQYTIAVRH